MADDDWHMDVVVDIVIVLLEEPLLLPENEALEVMEDEALALCVLDSDAEPLADPQLLSEGDEDPQKEPESVRAGEMEALSEPTELGDSLGEPLAE